MSIKVINYKSILKCKYINIVKTCLLVKSYEKQLKTLQKMIIKIWININVIFVFIHNYFQLKMIN